MDEQVPEVRVRSPRGVRDLLPDEAGRKSRLEARIGELFARWGYRLVVTPIFEYLETVQQANGDELVERVYRFVDREGGLVALRPELTTPIARLVATRLQEAPKPLRLYYCGPVFRYDEPQAGWQREFTQMGVELIGAPGPAADAEVIAVAVAVMSDLQLRDFRIDLGHVGYTSAVLADLQLPSELYRQVKKAFLRQDYVGLEQVLAQSGVESWQADGVLQLIRLRGDESILDAAARLVRSEAAEAALANLRAVYARLGDFGVAGRVRLDLGMVKHFDYYTGIVIEGYTPELGFSLCTGGRYDGLIGRFGYDVPATGFALGVERLLLALSRNGQDTMPETPPVLFVAEERRMREACDTAWRLRMQGEIVEIDVTEGGREAALAYAQRRGIRRIIFFEGAPGDAVEWVEGERSGTMRVEDVGEERGHLA